MLLVLVTVAVASVALGHVGGGCGGTCVGAAAAAGAGVGAGAEELPVDATMRGAVVVDTATFGATGGGKSSRCTLTPSSAECWGFTRRRTTRAMVSSANACCRVNTVGMTTALAAAAASAACEVSTGRVGCGAAGLRQAVAAMVVVLAVLEVVAEVVVIVVEVLGEGSGGQRVGAARRGEGGGTRCCVCRLWTL